jgi:mannose-6-phosphate isomerase-like protein (cupin superfamily)
MIVGGEVIMKTMMSSIRGLSIILGLMVFGLCMASTHAKDTQKAPAPKVISHNVPEKDYLPLLAGPPETVTMRSGRVALAPGKSVGKHSTGDYEEVLVIMEGQGEMRITGGETLLLNKNVVAYCPPHKEHDVFNTGTSLLRYVYIVAATNISNADLH